MTKILQLIAEIIDLIISGIKAREAVTKVSTYSGVDKNKLWDLIPSKYK